jgi:hypothetical protein
MGGLVYLARGLWFGGAMPQSLAKDSAAKGILNA